MLGTGVPCETGQRNCAKKVLDGGELAAITLNDPATGPLVVRTAVTDSPGRGVFDISHCPVVFGGKFWVERDPVSPAMLMFVTLTPLAPNAKPPCWGAFAGRMIVNAYEVPLPAAVHVSPVGTCPAAPAGATRNAAGTNTPLTTPQNLLISLLSQSPRTRRIAMIVPSDKESHS